MSDTSKINLKIGQIEISIEGPSEFVSQQYDKVEAHLKTYSDISTNLPQQTRNSASESTPNDNSSNSSPQKGSDLTNLPETFGEWLNKIDKGTNDTSKAILAGYYVQTTSASKNFRVREISKILKEHGIKLSNASTFIQNAVKNKKVFQVSKTGSEAHFKLTREAEDEMKTLLTSGN